MTEDQNVHATPAEPRKRPLVWTVLVNWNGWQDTLSCLKSLSELDYPNNHVTVVDNASTNDSVTRLTELWPGLDLRRTRRNLGFAGGNNVGIRAALAAGADYVWLLNNDTVVEAGTLTALVDALDADPRAAAAGSKIYYLDRPNVIWYAGGEITPEGPARHVGPGEVDTGQYDQQREVDYITGCSMLARSSVIRQVGLMRERYFVYWEEVDWNVRMADAGYRLLYVPTSRLWHKVSASSPEETGLLEIEYLARNMLLFYRLNRPGELRRVLRNAQAREQEMRELGYPENADAQHRGILAYRLRRFGRIRPRPPRAS